MSYDCAMVVDTGGEFPTHVEDIGNMTWNVGDMFQRALGARLSDLDMKTGAELIPLLEKATSHIWDAANEAEYRAMEPSNGWGSLDGARRYLDSILRACRTHPKAMLHVY